MSQRTIISTGLLLLLMVMMLLVTYGEPVRLTQASREIWEAMTVFCASMINDGHKQKSVKKLWLRVRRNLIFHFNSFQESSSHSAIIIISTTLTTLRTSNYTNLTTGLMRRQFSLTTSSSVWTLMMNLNQCSLPMTSNSLTFLLWDLSGISGQTQNFLMLRLEIINLQKILQLMIWEYNK